MGSGEFNARGNSAMDWHPIQAGVEIRHFILETISFKLIVHWAWWQIFYLQSPAPRPVCERSQV